MRFAYLLLFACAVPVTQEAAYLDLVTKPVQPRLTEPASVSATGGGAGAGDGAETHPPPQPLQVTVSNVEGAENKIGENLIYEVKILNTGNGTVKIPWVPSPRDIEPAKPGPYEYWMANLAPRLVNSSGQVAALEAVVLYGSDAPSTMLELAPGHWVRVRAKTQLNLRGPGGLASFLSAGQGSVRVGAVWSLYRVSFAQRNGQFHETFIPNEQENRSTNTVPIHIVLNN